VLITGGAGFVGANVATALAARHPEWSVVALDNLRRRGSELSLPRLRAAGVRFVHGDVRDLDDLLEVGPVQHIVECSAEPSVLAGVDGGTGYPVRSNLLGAWHCLELARRHRAQLVFLSSSRVYPVRRLREVRLTEQPTRFALDDEQIVPGVSGQGIAEDFPMEGHRTLYGATKLAAELLMEEYATAFDLPVVVNRCGVIAGPGQLGKVDQGVVTWWVLAHHFRWPLSYIGYGGTGKQVRDLLHVDDLVELVEAQLLDPPGWMGARFNVGGGLPSSASLVELTALCREAVGREVPIGVVAEERPGDVPIYLSDCRRLFAHTSWRPQRGVEQIVREIARWVAGHERQLQEALAA
jgi:CDP-paratose 2-epimerase